MEKIATGFLVWLVEYGFVGIGVALTLVWGVRQISCIMLVLIYCFLKREGYEIKGEQKIFGKAYKILSVRKKWGLRYPLYLTARHFIHYFLWLNVFKPAENGIKMIQQAKELVLSFKFRQDALEKVSAALDDTLSGAKIWDLPSMYLIRWVIWYIVRGLTWCDKIDVLPNLVLLGQTIEKAAVSAEKKLDALEILQEQVRCCEITSPEEQQAIQSVNTCKRRIAEIGTCILLVAKWYKKEPLTRQQTTNLFLIKISESEAIQQTVEKQRRVASQEQLENLETQIQRVIFVLSEIDRLRGLYHRDLRRKDRKEKQKLYEFFRQEEELLKRGDAPECRLYLIWGQIRASNFRRREIDNMASTHLLELKKLRGGVE